MKKFDNGSIHLTDEDYDKVEVVKEAPEPAPRESDYDRLKRNHYI